ncbi:hypothetical protein NPIL_662441 [Nephila pilipes]|uniref:Uncharacterized protein n=1 Tax=Nephila pilipes TaxID=299642 RepID=A0A8X6QTZ8_NEPPI|nr:hypothetical protein NPIL_662441 [Nephila pilipes]
MEERNSSGKPLQKLNIRRTLYSDGFQLPSKHTVSKAGKKSFSLPSVPLQTSRPSSTPQGYDVIDIDSEEEDAGESVPPHTTPSNKPNIPPFFITPKSDWSLLSFPFLEHSLQSKLSGHFLRLMVGRKQEYLKLSAFTQAGPR